MFGAEDAAGRSGSPGGQLDTTSEQNRDIATNEQVTNNSDDHERAVGVGAADMTNSDVIRQAADEISSIAQVIKETHAVNGQWPEGELRTQMKFVQMTDLARQLRRIASELGESK